MSVNKLLAEEVIKVKKDIKNRYLAGENIGSIAKSYGVSKRNIYFHLNKLSPNDKAMHAKNIALRKIVINQQIEKRRNAYAKNENKESKRAASSSSLVDFVG